MRCKERSAAGVTPQGSQSGRTPEGRCRSRARSKYIEPPKRFPGASVPAEAAVGVPSNFRPTSVELFDQASENHQKPMVFLWFLHIPVFMNIYHIMIPILGSKIASGLPQDRPKTDQDGPKLTQDGPKTAPRRPKTTPRRPHGRPRGAQSMPKEVQGEPKGRPKRPKRPP